MAFSAVALQNAIYNATNTPYGQNNLRKGDFTAIRLLLDASRTLIPGFAEIREASTHTTQALVMGAIAEGAKTTRQCVAAGTGTPELVTLNWNTILEELRVNDVEHQGSIVKMNNARDFLVGQKSGNLYSRLRTEIGTYLEANKSTLNAGQYFPDIATGVKTIPLEQEKNLFNGLMAEMQDNLYAGSYWVFGNYNFWADKEFIAAQGSSNSENLATFNENFTFAHVPVANAADMKSTFYVVPAGMVAMIPWLRPDFRGRGRSLPNAGIKTSTRLPGVTGLPNGLLVEVKYDEACTGEAEFEEGWSFSLDRMITHPFEETAGESVIFKYQVTSVAAV